MSLITCRQCRKTIPADSVRCPTCDIVNPGKRDFLAAGVTLIVVLGVVYAGWRTVAWITAPSEAPPSRSAQVRFSDIDAWVVADRLNRIGPDVRCTREVQSDGQPQPLVDEADPLDIRQIQAAAQIRKPVSMLIEEKAVVQIGRHSRKIELHPEVHGRVRRKAFHLIFDFDR